MKNVLKKYILNFVWIGLFAFIALYFSLKGDLNSVLHVLSDVNIYWVMVALIFVIIYQVLEGLILRMFGRLYNRNYTLKQACVNSFSAAFFNGITPFQSGGQFAQVYIFSKQGVLASHSVSILLMNFIVYQSTVVLYTLVILLLRYHYYKQIFSHFFMLALIGFLINFIVICSLFLGAKSKRLQDFFVNVVLKIGAKFRLIKDYDVTSEKCRKQLQDFRRELGNLSQNKSVIFFGGIGNIIKLTILYSVPFFCAKALHIDMTGMQFLESIGISAFIYMITSFVPIPGASGGSEGTFVIMFSVLLGQINAKSTMLVWRLVTYYLMILIGAMIFLFNKEINRRDG